MRFQSYFDQPRNAPDFISESDHLTEISKGLFDEINRILVTK